MLYQLSYNSLYNLTNKRGIIVV
ncbi:hypothetical protein NMYAN_220003 [Nitrosomonas nitrosa]|uniref:Uncharacterized protein n=1 Tax=Nitrosomonas nitrosa TaxID=52442 RepID=A0A8H9DBH8_9PROT|nr:hypothetical protein NMYAN_220003 [Nitrosomonas nitrosa]